MILVAEKIYYDIQKELWRDIRLTNVTLCWGVQLATALKLAYIGRISNSTNNSINSRGL